MLLASDKGEWESFQVLRYAYLRSTDGKRHWLDPGPFDQDDWNPDKLHASDVGACPRAVAYRLLGTPEKPRSRASAANRQVMFWAGYRLHYLTYSALNWAGLLLSHETRVPMPNGWTGAFDATFKPTLDSETMLYGMKTVLPNALKHGYDWDYPKTKDCLQEGVYGLYLPYLKRAAEEYSDRAGSNTPKICEFDLAPWSAKATEVMASLEDVRDRLPELPELLSPVLAPSYWKKRKLNAYYLKSLSYQADWRCGYCDYHLTKKVDGFGVTQSDSVCKPYNLRPTEVATFKDGHMISCKKEFEVLVDQHFKNLVPEYEYEDDDD